MTLEGFINDYEKQIEDKDNLLKQLEKDRPEKRTMTVRRLTESKEKLETLVGFLKELKEYREGEINECKTDEEKAE